MTDPLSASNLDKFARDCRHPRMDAMTNPTFQMSHGVNRSVMGVTAFVIMLAFMLLSTPVSAQGSADDEGSTGKVNIAGTWSFKTDWYYAGDQRRLAGEMTLTPNGDGGWICSFSNGEYARDVEEPTATAEQRCVVREVNNALIIRSQVVSASTANYQPDHFDLRVVDADTLAGTAFSWMPLGPVVFRRIEMSIS